MATTVQKWGNSLGIRIPRNIAEQVSLTQGTAVEFEAHGDSLLVRPCRRRRYRLADLLKQAKGSNPHGEVHRDDPVGRELL